MNKFNVGDVVVCKSAFQSPELSVNDRYEVANVRKNSYGEDQVWLSYFNKWYTSRRFILQKQPKEFELVEKYNPNEATPPEVVALGDELVTVQTEWTDKHYDNNYTLTQQDIERGFVKVDPYFVSKIWKIGSKDDSGALWHNKNKYSREIKPSIFVDVYDVLRAFSVTDPCLSHLAKKALCAGLRGHKDRLEDLMDIKASIERAIEMHKEWSNDA